MPSRLDQPQTSSYGPESPVEPAPAPEPTETPAHYCQEHQTTFKQHSRGENVWWSRKTGGWRVVPGEVGRTTLLDRKYPWGSVRGP
jgi:hypothetical protein